MQIAISGRSVVDSDEFSRIARYPQTVPNNMFAPKLRTMRQAISPFLTYEFTFPPSTFTHEGYGVTLNEITRPYSTPIVDVTGGKALRCSFEFAIAAKPGGTNALINDGFTISIDKEIQLLHEIANYGIPVDFDNVHDALSTPLWNIDNISFSHTRINSDGHTTAASCSISLVEFTPRSQKMILLPRFLYGKFQPPGKPPNVPDQTKLFNDIAKLEAEIKANQLVGDKAAARWNALALAELKKQVK